MNNTIEKEVVTMSQKLAIFDIDKTIIQNDSMFAFLLYGIKKNPAAIHQLLMVGLYSVLYAMKLMSADRAKSAYFSSIRYMDETDLQHFFRTKLKPRIYPQAMEEIRYRKQEGFHVLLVTASPATYMKYFKELNEVDEVIGTELVMKEGRYTGIIEGKNCKGEEKVTRIQRYLKDNNMALDYEHSCAYSDSLSDIPMLTLVKNRFLINRKTTGNCEGLSWNI
ncbi:HAD family hydrolase [Paenibacillus marinisediminis]